jgi:hypothetical protein
VPKEIFNDQTGPIFMTNSGLTSCLNRQNVCLMKTISRNLNFCAKHVDERGTNGILADAL